MCPGGPSQPPTCPPVVEERDVPDGGQAAQEAVQRPRHLGEVHLEDALVHQLAATLDARPPAHQVPQVELR